MLGILLKYDSAEVRVTDSAEGIDSAEGLRSSESAEVFEAAEVLDSAEVCLRYLLFS